MQRFLEVSLETKINGILLGVITLIVVSLSVFYLYHSSQEYYGNAERLTLQSAKTISFLPSLVDGGDLEDNETVQTIANQYIFENDMNFVIIKDREGIIVSHPIASRIGTYEAYDEGDKARIFGAYSIDYTDQYIEPAIIGIAPIYAGDEARQISGVVKVGYFQSSITDKIIDKLYQLMFISAAFIFISFFISRWFGNYIKSETLGYEPKQITMILKNRENIFSSLDEGIVASDLEGNIIYLNDAAISYLDAPADYEGRNININAYISEELIRDDSRSYNGVKYFEIQLNGKEIVTIVNDLYEKDEIAGHVLILRDMTEMSELANKLSVVESLFDDLRAQSHEYKNRLHLISGLLEMERFQSIREVLNEEIDSLDLYQKNLKNVEEDHIKALLIAKMNKAAEKRIDFVVDKESHFEDMDYERVVVNSLITIISNLIDNAIEAVGGEEHPKILFYIDHFDGWLEIVVEDNGPGFKDKDQIFKKGYSTKGADSERGYGLYNVIANVELMNGYIDVERNNDRTRFTVEIPLSGRGGET
ncbi:ATP-binding protein [Salinicoccus roseus]|uniref:ATP-binding protein n=1 Tax=Salinicoccus roseus TaxID=45670 RepID=UPI003DA0CCD5